LQLSVLLPTPTRPLGCTCAVDDITGRLSDDKHTADWPHHRLLPRHPSTFLHGSPASSHHSPRYIAPVTGGSVFPQFPSPPPGHPDPPQNGMSSPLPSTPDHVCICFVFSTPIDFSNNPFVVVADVG